MRFLLLALFAIACSSNGTSESCVTNANCESNRCVSGLCVSVSDSGPLPDAAADTEAVDAGDEDDAGTADDAGNDAGTADDAGVDAAASGDAGDAAIDAP